MVRLSVHTRNASAKSKVRRRSVAARREATSKSAPTKKDLQSSTGQETLALFGRMSTTTSVVALCGNIHTAGREGTTSASIVCKGVVVDSTHPRSNSHQAASGCRFGYGDNMNIRHSTGSVTWDLNDDTCGMSIW